MIALRRSEGPLTSHGPAGGTPDVLALSSLGLAFLIAITTAHSYMPLVQNPRVVLFAAFDAAVVLYLCVALSVCQRHRVLGAWLGLLIANGLLAASCAKMIILGEPGLLADLLLVPDLLRVIDPVLAGAGVAATATVALAYLVNLSAPRSAREAALLVPVAVVGVIVLGILHVPAVSHAAAGSIPVQGRGFPVFGHFYSAYSGFAREADWRHTVRSLRAEGGLALPFAPLRTAPLQSLTPRNLHILVIESLTDPGWYPSFGLGDQALPPLFERWRRESRATALSPVFGNRSSNAEFEVLCGVPAAVSPSDVVFWRLPERPLPCLPNRLAELGYRSVALHPSPRRTFNLSKAYPALGFEQWAFAEDLDFADRDGWFLSARATLEQHWQRVQPLIDDVPILSYVFVNASHYPYDRDERRRPTRWRPAGASPLVIGYLNAVHYMMIAVDGFVDRLLAADPDSLIVIVGDHAPALGPNFQGQRDGGRIAVDDADPLGRAAMYEVPLILLDRGELVPLGRLPTYLLPYAVLDRLGACGDEGCAWDAPWRLRPFRDRALLVEPDGDGERACSVDQPSLPCEDAARQALAWQLELLELIERPASAPRR